MLESITESCVHPCILAFSNPSSAGWFEISPISFLVQSV
jgi:hypothetical protein